MLCDRCGDPIPPGVTPEVRIVPSPSGAGGTVHLHPWLCEQPTPLRQTAPEPRVVIREP